MEEKLKAGFTLTFGLTKDKRIRGGYLKLQIEELFLVDYAGEEILFVSNYPNILEEITGNNILQIYKSPDGYVSMVGLPKTECSFCENNYLDMISSSINEVLIDGLEELDRNLSLKEEIPHQKYINFMARINIKLRRFAMKNNYPIKYAVMPIIEQTGWYPGLNELEREYE